jgi:hypothetical protein
MPPPLFVQYAWVLPRFARAIFLLYLSPRIICSRFLVLPPYEDIHHLHMYLLHVYHLVCIIMYLCMIYIYAYVDNV